MVAKPASTGVFARKVMKPLGFTKTYNFILYIIFGGAFVGFVLARFPYLNFSRNFCPADGPSKSGNSAAPGECYYYLNFTRYKVGILLHLAGVLPASLIAVAQFTPFIRYRWIIVHRVGGYAALFLYLIGLAGAFMVARHAFGGGLDVQSAVGVSGIATLGSFITSYINVKRLQIEQHRAWMLRGWFYAGGTVTARFIILVTAKIIASQGYYIVWTCAKIAATVSKDVDLATSYPSCAAYVDGTNPDAVSSVEAVWGRGGGDTANVGAALNLVFGVALWVSFALHAAGVEIYLHLTPREAERLRQVSYQRQLEAGMRNPGSAGLTADRLGDAHRWSPEAPKEHSTSSAEVVTIVPDSIVESK